MQIYLLLLRLLFDRFLLFKMLCDYQLEPMQVVIHELEYWSNVDVVVVVMMVVAQSRWYLSILWVEVNNSPKVLPWSLIGLLVDITQFLAAFPTPFLCSRFLHARGVVMN